MSVTSKVRGIGFLVDESSPDEIVIPDDMGADERLLMRSIEEFAAQEVAPHLERIEQRDEEIILPLFRKAADLGIFMAEVPEEHGGLGLNVLAIAGMSEKRSAFGGLASTVFAHQGIGTLPLINFGTEAQRSRYLQRCMDGRIMAAFALTEPGSGSDAMNIRTTAVLNDRGTHYVVNGAKQWITNAGWADLFILFAKVDGTKFTAFLLDRETPGLTVGGHERLLGLHGSSVCALTLEDVAIPVENLLGEIGKGHRVALCTLNLGRMKMAANCAGTSKKALATACAYAAERQQFGRPIASFGLIQAKLSEMAARAYAAESVAYRTAGLVYTAIGALDDTARDSLDAKLATLAEFSAECAMAKVFGTETYHGLADEALQIFGGNGYSEDYPVARMYRDSRITRIYEGTSEICRLSIGKAMLKRLDRGSLELPRPILPLRLEASGGDPARAAALRGPVAGLRAICLDLLSQAVARFGTDRLLDDDRQGYLGGIATVAIELYAAESTALRVRRLEESRPGADTSLAAALARRAFERAAGRVRQEAAALLSGLHTGDDLREALAAVDRRLPLPADRIALDGRIARALVERGGALPDFAAA
ncbi:MAG: acyl-CoA dehydrogenase family protein [Acidobacteria bacterium]|nr:acyl-CoA dehydrogenase family protein [Acidobacteriota bacterium]